MLVDSTLMQWSDLEDRREWNGILVGNGASRTVRDKFRYQSQYETAQTDNIEHQLTRDDKRMFDQFETENFEQVLAALATSEIVCEALGLDPTTIVERYGSIQQALFEAVHFVHVPWQPEDADVYARIGEALLSYNYVCSTNYDLIIYWSVMADGGRGFKDYFFSHDGEFDLANTELWGKSTKVLYLHGGIHLARLSLGGTVKRMAGAHTNILDSLEEPRMDGAIPLFITEGTSDNKLGSIYRSDYLSFAYQQFAQHSGPAVLFGSGLDTNDEHLVTAMSRWSSVPIAVSIYPSMSDRRVVEFKTGLQRRLPKAELHYFDHTSHPLGSDDLSLNTRH